LSVATRLFIWGASGHALVVADIIRQLDLFEIVGFLDDIDPQPRSDPRLTASILGGRDVLTGLRRLGVEAAIVAVGDCAARLELAAIAEGHGFVLATAIHPRAVVAADVAVGRGSVICAGAIVNPGARISANVIVNTSASVDHECVLEDGVHISPGAHLGGSVFVGRGAWVGIGAAVAPGVRIGARSVVGAGSVVLEDVPESVVAYGVPATVRKGAKTA